MEVEAGSTRRRRPQPDLPFIPGELPFFPAAGLPDLFVTEGPFTQTTAIDATTADETTAPTVVGLPVDVPNRIEDLCDVLVDRRQERSERLLGLALVREAALAVLPPRLVAVRRDVAMSVQLPCSLPQAGLRLASSRCTGQPHRLYT